MLLKNYNRALKNIHKKCHSRTYSTHLTVLTLLYCTMYVLYYITVGDSSAVTSLGLLCGHIREAVLVVMSLHNCGSGGAGQQCAKLYTLLVWLDRRTDK